MILRLRRTMVYGGSQKNSLKKVIATERVLMFHALDDLINLYIHAVVSCLRTKKKREPF